MRPDEIEGWRADVPAPAVTPLPSVPAEGDPASEWHTEENTQRLLVEWLAGEGWTIVRTANTATREHGLDVVAERDGQRLGVEVKGYPSRFYVAGPKKGQVKTSTPKEQAKKWYAHLTRDFASHPLAAKAQGAARRLELEGKVFDLAGPVLGGGTFTMDQVRGKLVVVYYWASWNQQCVGDFAKLKLMLEGRNNLALVCVNLDNTAEEATGFLRKIQAPGVHLFQPGGLDSPLATQYGVMGLPSLFLVGKDGKVLSRTVQVATLEEELKKQKK